MFSAARTPPHIFTLVALTGVSVMSLNMFLPSLPSIARDFEVSYVTASWSIAGYLGLTAVLQLVMGPLSDLVGRRPVMLWGLFVFALASVGCALSESFGWFLFFRLAQGAIASCMTLGRAVVRDLFPPQLAAAKLGLIGMAMAIAPMMGPLLGGMLDEALGWRSVFWAFAVMGAALWGLVWIDLGETNHTRSASFGDQFRTYPELFRSRRFWGYAICLTFSVGTFHIFLAGAPLVGASQLALTPSQLGFAMGSTSAGFFLGTFISNRIAARVPLSTMSLAGRWVGAAGVGAGLLLMLATAPGVVLLFGASIFVGFGNGLTMPSANAGVMSVRPSLSGSASGLSGAMTVAGAAVFTYGVSHILVAVANPAAVLLTLMLASILAGALCILYVKAIDRREPMPVPGE